MYIYYLSVAMGSRKVVFDDELVDILCKSIAISNNGFSANRFKRTIEFVEVLDPTHVKLKMISRDAINPTRSLSSLSRALIYYVNQNCPGYLDDKISASNVFRASTIDELQGKELNYTDMGDADLVKHIVSLMTDDKYAKISKDTLVSLKKTVAKAINSLDSEQ